MIFNSTLYTIAISLVLSALLCDSAAAADHLITIGELRKMYPHLTNNTQLKKFQEALGTQGRIVDTFEEFITTGHKVLKTDQQLKESENKFFKSFTPIAENDPRHIVSFTSCQANAWAMRYFHTVYNCTQSDNPEEQQNAQQIINAWQNTDDKELKIVLAYFKQILITNHAQALFRKKQNAITKEFIPVYNNLKNKDYKSFIERHKDSFTALIKLGQHFNAWNYALRNASSDELDIQHQPNAQIVFPTMEKTMEILQQFGPQTETYEKIEQTIRCYRQARDIDAYKKLLDDKFAPQSIVIKSEQKTATSANEGWIAHLTTPHNKANLTGKGKSKKKHKRPNRSQAQKHTEDQIASSSSSCSTPKQQNDSKPKIAQIVEPPKKCSQDGSYTDSENDTLVHINDPKNKVQVTLFKLSEPQAQLSHPAYTPNVTAWFKDVKKTLKIQGYNDPENPKHKFRDTAVLVHSFALEADKYLTQCGVESTIINNKNKKHIAITMPGCIKYPDKQDPQYGLCTYFVDTQNGECYHRNFVKKSKDAVYAEYMRDNSYQVEDVAFSSEIN